MSKVGAVLLVDDEPLVLGLNAAVVRSFGFETLTAENVDDALDILRRNPVILVISDVQMPGGGGFDFVKQLIEAGLKTMPVVFLTGYDDIDVLRGGLTAGGDDIIIKGRPVEWVRERIAFWTASGFKALPKGLASRALAIANKIKGDDFVGIERALRRREALSVQVLAELAEELKACPRHYGIRQIERVCFLARVCRLVMKYAKEPGDFVRFPDYIYFVIKAISPIWVDELPAILNDFSYWAEDSRFLLAGNQPLMAIDQYDWAENL